MLFDGVDLSYIDVRKYVGGIFDKTVHSKRLDSIANAALGIISSTSLIVHRIGIGLADLNGLMDKHAIKQEDRLLSNTKFNLESMFGSWVNFVIGQRTEIKVVMDWSEFKHDKQTTNFQNTLKIL